MGKILTSQLYVLLVKLILLWLKYPIFVSMGLLDKEACPNNLAPTASTTLAMALGDALAVSLMRSREFSSSDFAQFHPDGSLGRRLSKVSDYMKKDVLSLSPEDSFTRALEVMTAKNYGISAVLNDRKDLIGAMTDGDVRRALLKKIVPFFLNM